MSKLIILKTDFKNKENIFELLVLGAAEDFVGFLKKKTNLNQQDTDLKSPLMNMHLDALLYQSLLPYMHRGDKVIGLQLKKIISLRPGAHLFQKLNLANILLPFEFSQF